MAEIHIERAHTMPHKKAREAAEGFARQLDEKFDLESAWEGDTMHFRRAGVDGSLVLEKHKVVIRARLGLLLSAFKSRFEEHIHDNLDRIFDGHAAPAKKTAARPAKKRPG
ncbi:MAG: polyhydroxyalkanoic acid system family protein [Burkholderiales bacterium]|nr:polyhydroxyalkanoic acid system family protein [Burkholderiales bacterium]